MKLYFYEYSSGSRRIRKSIIEAEEKAKIYVTTNRRRINKDDIGKLKGGYFKEMFLLSDDISKVLTALLECNICKIEKNRKEFEELSIETRALEDALKREKGENDEKV